MDKSQIEAEAHRLGHIQRGWRFMACPEANLRRSPYALVSLNPGGKEPHPDHPEWSQEKGSSYRVESWKEYEAGKDPLQRQIQKLSELIGQPIDELFAAHFVPFRSPKWEDLTQPNESLEFSERLWLWALAQSPAKTIFAMGKGIVAPAIVKMLGGTTRLDRFDAGWGTLKIERIETVSGRIVIALPHLSRFRLFGRAGHKAEQALRLALR